MVLGAAVWKLRAVAEGYWYYLDILLVVLLGSFGFFLFLVNGFNGVAKLRQASRTKRVFRVVLFAYCLVSISVVVSLLWKV